MNTRMQYDPRWRKQLPSTEGKNLPDLFWLAAFEFVELKVGDRFILNLAGDVSLPSFVLEVTNRFFELSGVTEFKQVGARLMILAVPGIESWRQVVWVKPVDSGDQARIEKMVESGKRAYRRKEAKGNKDG